MYVRNDAGEMVFDTDEGLFVITDELTGSVVIPARTGSYNAGSNTWSPYDGDVDHTVSTTINVAADTVRGTFDVSTATSNAAFAQSGEYNAGGTYMHVQFAAEHETQGAWKSYYPNAMATYTFIASGGTLTLNERAFIRAPIKPFLPSGVLTTTISTSTLNYNLLIGTFV